jgi:hypothetical protein
MSLHRSTQALVLLTLSVFGFISSAPPSSAATSRIEAESLAAPGACWSTLAWSPLSGGSSRTCFAPLVPLTWKVSVASGETAKVHLYGYRDAVARAWRVRIDSKSWVNGTLTGASAPSALFYTTPELGSGTHTIELESVVSAGGFTFDYFEVESAVKPAPATTTTTVKPTTTTTAPPPTTTTPTAPPTPTTTAPPPTTTTTAPPAPTTTTTTTVPGVCNINPADGQSAISAAIRACADGSTVRFPAGRTYNQTDEINVVGRKNLVIDGNGSTFISSAPNDPWATIYHARPNWQIVEGTNVTLTNMTIRGNLPKGPRGILPGNQYNSGVMIYGGNGINITDISVYSVFGEFVVSNPSGFYYGGGALDGQVPTNVTISRLRGQSAARQCVSATAAQGFWLQDSELSDCYQNGVDLEPDVAGERVRDAHILRNTISGYYFSAITVPTAYQAGDVDGVEIRGNKTTSTSDTCYPAVLVGGVQDNANALYNVVVADNTLRTLYEGVKHTHVASGSVTGNDVTITVSPNYCGPPTASPVRLINSSNVVVHSNTTTGY